MKVFFAICLWCLGASVGFSQVDSTVIYLNNNFEKVSKEEADFYRVLRITDAATGRGYQKDFYITGEKYREIYYSKFDSVREGTLTVWFKNGNLRERNTYQNGQLHGKAMDWYENGQIRWEQNFVNGYLHGDFKSYHANQQLKRHDIYVNGELISGHCYDEQGKEVAYYPFQTVPQYPGGQSAMLKFLLKKMNGPFKGPHNEGGKALISFIVDRTGKVGDARVVSTTHAYLGELGIKAVLAMPKWSPGIQDGQAVPVKYTVPFNTKKNY